MIKNSFISNCWTFAMLLMIAGLSEGEDEGSLRHFKRSNPSVCLRPEAKALLLELLNDILYEAPWVKVVIGFTVLCWLLGLLYCGYEFGVHYYIMSKIRRRRRRV